MAKRETKAGSVNPVRQKYTKQIGMKIPVSALPLLSACDGGVSGGIRKSITENLNVVSGLSVYAINDTYLSISGDKITVNFRLDSDLCDRIKSLAYRKKTTITSVVLICLEKGGFISGNH